MARPIHAIAVLGSGTMGHGIAQVAAAAGYAVSMWDVSADALARGLQSIERNLAKAIQLKKISTNGMSRKRAKGHILPKLL